MAEAIAIPAFCLLFPALALLAKEKIPFFSKWSPLVVCYAVGILAGNSGILPERATGILDGISTGAVALSIPLLLFSVDIRSWRKLAGTTLLALGLAFIAVLAVSAVAYAIFAPALADSWKVAGLLVGVYTGGTPNMAAIKTALDVDMNTYLAVHTSDMILSALYFLFVLTVAQRFFGLFMPAYGDSRRRRGGERAAAAREAPPPAASSGGDASAEQAVADVPFTSLFARGTRLPLLGAVGLDIAIVAASLGLSLVVPGEWQTLVVVLAVTSLALAASLAPKVRAIRGTFALGEYVLYVFCLAVGAMGDISKLIGTAPAYFGYVALVLFGSFALHAVLCALFRVDTDTMLVVSTATINSAPFVGLACVALKNRRLLVPGITAGIVGYALGNYLGIGLAQLLRALGG
jgi:uncharacterized membrane protein